MELFILLAAYVIVRVGEDVTAAVRKQPPPRHEYRMKKLDQRDQAAKARGYQPQEQGAFGRYVSGLMADAWDSAHHRRQLMADERQRRRERRIAGRIEKRQAKDERRDRKQNDKTAQSEPDQPDPVEFDVNPPEATGTEPTPEPVAAASSDNAEPHPTGTAATKSDADEATEVGEDTQPAETDRQDNTDDKEASNPSNVIPFPTVSSENTEPASPTRMELPSMTGEITGLNSAISYAENLSTYCAHTNDQIGSVLPSGTDASASCEQAREALAAGGVTGQPLSDVTAVQEQMTEAVAVLNQALAQLEAAGSAADSLRDRLTSHLSVQESYVANPDAGHREFVTAE